MIDETQARNELSKFFNDAWASVDWTPMDNGVAPTVYWEGRTYQNPPPLDVPFVRFNITPNSAGQSSLTGAEGETRWGNYGIVNVQCFGPQEWTDGFEVAEYIAIMAKRVFQGKATPNGIWFRNCRANKIGVSGGWCQFNTIVEYQFDEQR